MRCLVINLDRSPERLFSMEAQFAKHNMHVERVHAVDGQTYRGEYLQNAFCNIIGSPMTANEVACFLSHRSCWEMIAQGEDSHVAIFEDDVVISDFAWELLAGLPDWLDKVDILKIETFFDRLFVERRSIRVSGACELLKSHTFHSGAGGYILSKKTAKILLDKSKAPLNCAVDHFLFNRKFFPSKSLRVYSLSPALCIQSHFKSDVEFFKSTIDTDTSRRMIYKPKKKSFLGRLFQNFIQPIKRLYYKRLVIDFWT